MNVFRGPPFIRVGTPLVNATEIRYIASISLGGAFAVKISWTDGSTANFGTYATRQDAENEINLIEQRLQTVLVTEDPV